MKTYLAAILLTDHRKKGVLQEDLKFGRKKKSGL